MTDTPIPTGESITASWLTDRLHEAGHRRVTVDGFTRTQIGTGQIGKCIRFGLDLRGDDPNGAAQSGRQVPFRRPDEPRDRRGAEELHQRGFVLPHHAAAAVDLDAALLLRRDRRRRAALRATAGGPQSGAAGKSADRLFGRRRARGGTGTRGPARAELVRRFAARHRLARPAGRRECRHDAHVVSAALAGLSGSLRFAPGRRRDRDHRSGRCARTAPRFTSCSRRSR